MQGCINRYIKNILCKIINVYRKYGFIGFFKKIFNYIRSNYLDKISLRIIFNKRKYRNKIDEILSKDYERIIIWRSRFGYDVPLFQRPQHIASCLSKQNCLVLYEVTTMTDKVKTLKRMNDNLYLFNFNNIILNKILMNLLKNIEKPKYIQFYSTERKLNVDDI